MRVSLIGATGNAGSRILAELAQRGHQVTAVVRRPERVPRHDGVVAKECDVNRVDDLALVLRGHDVVVSSVHFLDGQAGLALRMGFLSLEGGFRHLRLEPGIPGAMVDTNGPVGSVRLAF